MASSTSVRLGWRLRAQQAGRGHQHARRADAALGGAMAMEGFLQLAQTPFGSRAPRRSRHRGPRPGPAAPGRRRPARHPAAPCRRRNPRHCSRSWCRSGPDPRAAPRRGAGPAAPPRRRGAPLRWKRIMPPLPGRRGRGAAAPARHRGDRQRPRARSSMGESPARCEGSITAARARSQGRPSSARSSAGRRRATSEQAPTAMRAAATLPSRFSMTAATMTMEMTR